MRIGGAVSVVLPFETGAPRTSRLPPRATSRVDGLTVRTKGGRLESRGTLDHARASFDQGEHPRLDVRLAPGTRTRGLRLLAAPPLGEGS